MPLRTHTVTSTTRRTGLALQKKANSDSARADGTNRKGEKVNDEEIERLARKAGLLECIDDAYLARGDWLPEAREFAILLQSAERGRCAADNETLRQEVSRLRKDEFLQELDGRLADENKKLRHMLFMAHGSEEHYLYGDDGERTCNTCWIDFNTDSPDVIEQKIYAYNMRKIAKLQAEGKWPPEFLKTENAKITGDTGMGEQK